MIRALPLFLALAACADFPEVGRAEAKLASPNVTPALLTAEELAAVTNDTAAPAPILAAEIAALRARAAVLRRR